METDTDQSGATVARRRAHIMVRVVSVGLLALLVGLLAWVVLPRISQHWRQPSASTTIVFQGQPETTIGGESPFAPMQFETGSVVSAVGSAGLRTGVARRLGIGQDEFDRYSVEAVPTHDPTGGLTGEVVITVTGPERATAARISDEFAIAVIAARLQEDRSQLVRAEQAITDKLAEYHGADKESADYTLLKQRLRDLRTLEDSVTADFRVVRTATDSAAR